MKKFNQLTVALTAGLLICGAQAKEPEHTQVEYAEKKGWKLIWNDEFDGSMTLRSPGQDSIRQFVIYAENKVGWLNDFISMLKDVDIHILAISVLNSVIVGCKS